MKELTAILDAWRADRQAPGVLATVVHVAGSAYRRPGARMLISADGCKRIGAISGGCLEGDVARKAAWWTASGKPVVRIYDTMSDDDVVFEFGLGCNGVIHVLLEPLASAGAQELLKHLDAAQRERRDAVVGTVVRTAHASSRYCVGEHIFQFRGELGQHAKEVLARRRSCLAHMAEADVFIEYVAPPQRLVVFGAGHDAIPVVALGASLGWEVTVADVRSGYAKPDRFPGANHVVHLPPSGDASALHIDPDTAVILMTHNLLLDAKLLLQLRRAWPAYCGVLGPKKRMAKLLDEAQLDISSVAPYLHSPAGLDLGGDAPEAIALSIIAEIQAQLHGRTAGSLRRINGSIHEPVREAGSEASDLTVPETLTAMCEMVLANG